MWLFRKSFDISRARPRNVTRNDVHAVSRLLRDGSRRFSLLSGNDLEILLAEGLGVALEAAGELRAVALISRSGEETCWLRAVAFAEGAEGSAGISALISALHTSLKAAGVRRVYFGGDGNIEFWLIPTLRAMGYQHDTDVLVYEKQRLTIPSAGNPAVRIRPATREDLPTILHLDQVCFEPQWTKDATVLSPAVEEGPYFVVAELDGKVVGYAYATAHFGGRLMHLVRIAVTPEHRRQRIGVSLLADLITYARERGASAVTLNTQAYNQSAQRLYRWFGFAPTGEQHPILRCDL
ncbi:MAG: GNAT family N-acetyltransferase [Oscillochloridaceae bacterium]|nr:GNAT family N-acetyltransferase [Chloroflexaceae bacterium]MDW8389397.1 GNAT family N-acetyltransferase [Oscillochloridaceae bacterium]